MQARVALALLLSGWRVGVLISPSVVTRRFLATVAICLIAVALSGCGRKGGLDAPPGASVVNQPVPAQTGAEVTPDGQPMQIAPPASPPPRTVLDWLID
jgi:predicted small lipoprotein YifL